MSDGLALLEKKLEQLLAYCESLRAENRALRSRVAKMEEERQMLTARIETARNRLEGLMGRIPEPTQAQAQASADAEPTHHSNATSAAADNVDNIAVTAATDSPPFEATT